MENGIGYQSAFDKAFIDLQAKDPERVCALAHVQLRVIHQE
jgi:hypothetical protein